LVPVIHNQSPLSTKKNIVPIIVLYVKAYNYDKLHLDLTNWDHIEQVSNVPVMRNPPRARRLADQVSNIPVRRNPPRARLLPDQVPNVPVRRRNPPREIQAHTRVNAARGDIPQQAPRVYQEEAVIQREDVYDQVAPPPRVYQEEAVIQREGVYHQVAPAPAPAPAPTYKVYKFDETCDENEICPICYEYLQINSFVKLNCTHIFCKSCIILCNALNITNCAICRIDITKIYTQNPIVNYSI
jgi:hypothetical protein